MDKFIKIYQDSLIESQKNGLENIFLAYSVAKVLVSSGQFKDFNRKSERKKLCDVLQVSDSTLRRYYKRWVELGWAEKISYKKGVYLKFHSKDEVNKLITGNTKPPKRNIKFKFAGIKQTKKILKGYQLLDNLDSQRHKIITNLYRSDKVVAQLLKDGKYKAALEVSLEHKYGRIGACSFNVGISRQGTATYFGRKSHTTGQNYIKSLSKEGFLKETKQEYELSRLYDVPTEYMYLTKLENEKGYTYCRNVSNGDSNYVRVMKKLPNFLEFNLSSLFSNLELKERDRIRFEKTVRYTKFNNELSKNNRGETLFGRKL